MRERGLKKDESLARSKKNSRWEGNREEENETRISHFIQLRRLKTPLWSPPPVSALPSLISLYRCSFSKQNYTPPRWNGVLFKIPCPFPRFAGKAARTHAEGVAREAGASLSLFNLILNWSLPGAETRLVPPQRWEISTDNSWKLAFVGSRVANVAIDEIEEDN